MGSLAEVMPEITKEWHPRLNREVSPETTVPSSSRIVWWICDQGHEWEARINYRTRRGTSCPYCSNNRVLAGFNDLESKYPDLASEWSRSRNFPLKPSDVVAGSNKKYWWVCELNHEWEQSPNIRVRGNKCPYCANQKLWPGFNDLATKKPWLAKQWNTQRNGISPQQIMANARFDAWWKCDVGHEWQSSLRGRKDGNCSICLNRTFLEGFNDLQTKLPDLAAEWDYEGNEGVTPSQVPFASRSEKYWWRCASGHVWAASIASRKIGNSCPICSNQALVPGINDMTSTHPEIATSFDLVKNAPLTPSDIFAGSAKKFWWICPQGHQWNTTANSRFNGRGCPTCAEYGFKPHKPAIFYFLENGALSARKVGITNSDERNTRLSGFIKTGWREILTIEDQSGERIQVLERALLGWLRVDLELPVQLTSEQMGRQGGWTETFPSDGISNDRIAEEISKRYREISGM